MTEQAATHHAVTPAGWPLLDAAEWVGRSCWAELHLHGALTDWLAVEADPARTASFWRLRASRAALAEAWHRHLPELREFPREVFVQPEPALGPALAPLDGLGDPASGPARVEALAGALSVLAARYRAHLAVAVGPADGPVADALRHALSRTESDLELLAPT